MKGKDLIQPSSRNRAKHSGLNPPPGEIDTAGIRDRAVVLITEVIVPHRDHEDQFLPDSQDGGSVRDGGHTRRDVEQNPDNAVGIPLKSSFNKTLRLIIQRGRKRSWQGLQGWK